MKVIVLQEAHHLPKITFKKTAMHTLPEKSFITMSKQLNMEVREGSVLLHAVIP